MTISNIVDPAASTAKLRGEGQNDRPKIVPDRRRYKRVEVSLDGRVMTEDKQEYPCQVFNMSPSGMAVWAPVTPRPMERVVAYLDNLGRLEGARTFAGGFAVEIKASSQKRERNLLT
jgi:hypothetical protein